MRNYVACILYVIDYFLCVYYRVVVSMTIINITITRNRETLRRRYYSFDWGR